MEKSALASAKPVLGLCYPSRTIIPLPLRRLPTSFPNSTTTVRSASRNAKEKLRRHSIFTSVSSASSGAHETSSVSVHPQITVRPPPSHFRSPLFWIGVGVGLSVFFSWLTSYLKKYATQEALETMMGSQNNQFDASNFPTGSPFSYPPPSTTESANSPPPPPPPATRPSASPATATSSASATTTNKSEVTVYVSATKIEATCTTDVKTDEEVPTPKKIYIEDVSPDEGLPTSPFEKYEDSSASTISKPFEDTTNHVKFATYIEDVSLDNGLPKPKNPFEKYEDSCASTASRPFEDTTKHVKLATYIEDVSSDNDLPKTPFKKYEDSCPSTASRRTRPFEDTSKDVKFAEMVTRNGAATASASNGSQSTGNPGPLMSMEALEKMMEDPTVQQMIYQYLPEEMRNPSTFKRMLQNPRYRKRLQDMLNNMGGSAGWNKQMMDQIGLTPEEVISKTMVNPDVTMAFQNPRVQAAIRDCSQNPFNITRYQNDKEVMDLCNKISQLFPRVIGSA